MKSDIGYFIASGTGIGTAVGVATGNIALCAGMGMALGCASLFVFGPKKNKRKKLK